MVQMNFELNNEENEYLVRIAKSKGKTKVATIQYLISNYYKQMIQEQQEQKIREQELRIKALEAQLQAK